MNRWGTWLFTLVASLVWQGQPSTLLGLVDDSSITVGSVADVGDKREALIQFIWGSDGFPATKLPSVVINVASPVSNLTNLERVDRLLIGMDASQESLAYHFIPLRKNHRLVIVHAGHQCHLDDAGWIGSMARTIDALLRAEYSVLAVHMPRFRPDDCPVSDGIFGIFVHDGMFNIATTGSPMKFFLEPVAVSLNYLKTFSRADAFPWYTEFYMVGLSGGGWTTTVYAAIDPTILLSFPVAGSVPLYLRAGFGGDLEQTIDAFYQLAGYPDLYVMGSYGASRKQLQILNRRDSCCFGEAQHDSELIGMSYDEAVTSYEQRVRQVVEMLGAGEFRLVIDEEATFHLISPYALGDVILPELAARRTCRSAPLACSDAVRGKLRIRGDAHDSARNKLQWSWQGEVADATDFGNPSVTTEYALCVYDDDTLVVDYAIQAAGECGRNPCWKSISNRGYRYDSDGTNADGIRQVEMERRTTQRRGKIRVEGIGANLPLPAAHPLFRQSRSLTVQLLRRDGPGCWQTRFPAPASLSSDTRFRDTLP